MPSESNKKPLIKDPQPVMPIFLPPLVLEQIFNFMNPIGSYYFNKTDPRSPSEIFGIGCGTWIAEAGYFPVGKASSGTFYTLGNTGGTETIALTVDQMPSHTHIQNPHRHLSVINFGGFQSLDGYSGYTYNNVSRYYNPTDFNTATNQNTGGGNSHNNLPPYRVVMMWVRIA